jgi:hypothetical protein
MALVLSHAHGMRNRVIFLALAAILFGLWFVPFSGFAQTPEKELTKPGKEGSEPGKEVALPGSEEEIDKEIAHREGITRARGTQVMGMLRLATEIQEQILFMPNAVHRPLIQSKCFALSKTSRTPPTSFGSFKRSWSRCSVFLKSAKGGQRSSLRIQHLPHLSRQGTRAERLG